VKGSVTSSQHISKRSQVMACPAKVAPTMRPPNVELVQSSHAAFRQKTVYIVRHAQGQHNVSPQFEFDPPLTECGLKQVQRKRAVTEMIGVDVVLVSPLRRTLQTACGLFPEHVHVVALEDLRERVEESCNLREDTATLRSWFPRVDMNLIEAGPDKWVDCVCYWRKWREAGGREDGKREHNASVATYG